MPKSAKTNSRKSASQPARKPVHGSAKPKKPQQRAAKPPSSRAPKVRSPATPVRPTKKAAIVVLLERPNGAAISDLAKATGWQVHSVRAALTGLRKEGKELVRIKDDGRMTHYRLVANA